MKAGWFRDLPPAWDPEIAWNDEELDRACELLAQISAANRGEVVLDEDLPEGAIEEHARVRVRQALGSGGTQEEASAKQGLLI